MPRKTLYFHMVESVHIICYYNIGNGVPKRTFGGKKTGREMRRMKKILHLFDKYYMRIYTAYFVLTFLFEILLAYITLMESYEEALPILYYMFVHLCIFMAYQLFEYKHKIGYFIIERN